MAGCSAPPPRAPARAPAPDPGELRDASYDWHVLLVAPFGTVLRDIPLPLHEVLLFHDEARGVAGDAGQSGSVPAECYATDSTAPRFFARTPDEYLLCFRSDRLFRIQASVHVAAPEASAVLAAVCADWMRMAGAGKPTTGDPAAGAVPAADGCEGRQDAVHFSGRLEADSDTAVSVTLDSAGDP